VAHACDPSYLGGRGRRIAVQDQTRKKHETLSEKLTTEQNGLGHGSVVKLLPSQYEVLSSIPKTTQKRKKREEEKKPLLV
jgi:hypothetical protein